MEMAPGCSATQKFEPFAQKANWRGAQSLEPCAQKAGWLLQVAQVCACQGPCGQKCEPFSQKTSWGAKNVNPSAYFHSGRPQTSNPSAYVRLWWLQTSNPNAYFVPWALQLAISSIGFVPWAIWGSKLQRISFSLFGSPPKT